MAYSLAYSPENRTVGAKTQVLAVGDWQQREFTTASAGIPDAHNWPLAADIGAACEILGRCHQPPELILLAQPLPGLYRQNDIDRLQQLVPLTRLVFIAGTWCEGGLRTGSPRSGVIRLYWYEFAPWWEASVRRRDAGQCPLWSLPLDHPQAGRWSAADDLSDDLSNSGSLLPVIIDAADYAVFETLAAVLSEQGIKAYRSGQAASGNLSGTAGIWDGGQLCERELTRLTNFCRQTDGPVIALLDFPRVEHFEQAQAAGASTVFAKPYFVEELIAAFAQE